MVESQWAQEDSEDEWLHELVRISDPCRKQNLEESTKRRLSDESDDEWVKDICRWPRGGLQSPTKCDALDASSGDTLAASSGDSHAPGDEAPSSGDMSSTLVPAQPSVAPVSSVLLLRNMLGSLTPCGGSLSVPESKSVRFTLPEEKGPHGVSLLWCLQRFLQWATLYNDMAVFKVGIAIDPVKRFSEYLESDGFWAAMEVVFQGSVQDCHAMERSLIYILKNIPGCYNVKPGGEGISVRTIATCHCYLVYAPAGHGKALRSVRTRRT